MIKFDISGIPKNSTLTKAEVMVYDYCPLYSGEKQLCAYTDNWDDKTITWNNAESEGEVLSSFYTIVMYGWENFDVKSYLSSAVQSEKKWLSFYIKQVYDGYRAHFHPSEYTEDVSLRPKLVIERDIQTDIAVNPEYKPCMSKLTFNNVAGKPFRVIIFNMKGRTVFTKETSGTQNYEGKFCVDMKRGGFTRGIYFVTYKSGNGKMLRKFVY